MKLLKNVVVIVLVCIQLAVIFPITAQAQSVDPLPKTERLRSTPMIRHIDYSLNYLFLYPGARGLGGEYTYDGSSGVNYGVSIVVYWKLLAGGTLGPIDVFINYRGEPGVFVFMQKFYRGVGSFTWYPQLGRPFQIWINNATDYNINA